MSGDDDDDGNGDDDVQQKYDNDDVYLWVTRGRVGGRSVAFLCCAEALDVLFDDNDDYFDNADNDDNDYDDDNDDCDCVLCFAAWDVLLSHMKRLSYTEGLPLEEPPLCRVE